MVSVECSTGFERLSDESLPEEPCPTCATCKDRVTGNDAKTSVMMSFEEKILCQIRQVSKLKYTCRRFAKNRCPVQR
jgi:hypothetical protein